MSTKALFAIARLTMLEVVRNRLLWLCLVGVLMIAGLAQFLGMVALTDSAEIKRAVVGSVLRLSAVVLLCLFVVNSMLREVQDKGLELLLSLPLGRWQFLLGKLLGFAALALSLAALCTLVAVLHADWLAALAWGATLAGELLIVMCLSVLCLFTFSQPTAAIAAILAFYVLARAIAALQLMSGGPLAFATGFAQDVLVGGVDALAFMLPDLDRFANSAWLAYGPPDLATLGLVAGQTVIYVLLLALASAFDLYRKNW